MGHAENNVGAAHLDRPYRFILRLLRSSAISAVLRTLRGHPHVRTAGSSLDHSARTE